MKPANLKTDKKKENIEELDFNPVRDFLLDKKGAIYSIKTIAKKLHLRKRQVYFYLTNSKFILKRLPVEVGSGKYKLNIFSFNEDSNLSLLPQTHKQDDTHESGEAHEDNETHEDNVTHEDNEAREGGETHEDNVTHEDEDWVDVSKNINENPDENEDVKTNNNITLSVIEKKD